MRVVLIIIGVMASCLSCLAQQMPVSLTDGKASKRTKALYRNLYKLSRNHILFGHQHATEYGHGWQGDANRSDVLSVTGSHPAVVGVDFSGLSGRSPAEIERNKQQLKKTIVDIYNRGGVVTVSWHFSNPASPGGFYWIDSVSQPAVPLLLPDGTHHQQYKQILQTIGSFAKSVRGKDGKRVPMIFRPYHEQDGDWFWWGKKHCTAEAFVALWRFTVTYLRDSLQVHNFIYAFSPDCKFTNEAEFLERYPGNEWVDMVGMDDYADFGREGKYNLDSGLIRLQIVGHYAAKANKLAAFTETGLESIPDTVWWTQKLLPIIQRKELQLCYVLVWRNDIHSPTHYYAPFPGHPSAEDFIRFYNSDFTLFENDLKKIYRK